VSDFSSGPVGAAATGWWRPTARVAAWLRVLLVAQAAAQITLLTVESGTPYVRLHRGVQALVDGRDSTARYWFNHAFDGTSGGMFQIASLLGIAVTVFAAVWTWRSAKNAIALGRTGARLSPGWAAAGWFIPVASLVMPYLAVQDLWRASDPAAARGSGWRQAPGAAAVTWWWVVHLAGSLVTFGATGLAVGGKIGAGRTETLLDVGHVITAVGALLMVAVVKHITERQGAQQAADPAPTAPVTAPRVGGIPRPVAAPTDPGAAAPVRTAPADWYPDPTGRFHWRYWTGSEWTEHVGRDGELFLDPLDDRPPTDEAT
jgi:hypothetical protein